MKFPDTDRSLSVTYSEITISLNPTSSFKTCGAWLANGEHTEQMLKICRFWSTLLSFSLLGILTMSAVAIIHLHLWYMRAMQVVLLMPCHHYELEWFLLVIAWVRQECWDWFRQFLSECLVGSAIITLFSRFVQLVGHRIFWYSSRGGGHFGSKLYWVHKLVV